MRATNIWSIAFGQFNDIKTILVAKQESNQSLVWFIRTKLEQLLIIKELILYGLCIQNTTVTKTINQENIVRFILIN